MYSKLAATRVIELNGLPYLCDRKLTVRHSVKIYEKDNGLAATSVRIKAHSDKRADGKIYGDIVSKLNFETGDLPLELY
jgi:hypothetical protein